MKYYNFIILSFVALFMASCAKEKPSEIVKPIVTNDTEMPVITYISELKTLYKVGVNVLLNFKVTDNKKLKLVTLKAVNTSIDSVYLEKSFLTSDKELIVKDSITTNLTTTMANFTIFIEATDSSGNKSILNKAFHVMN
jgi:hypothetical protein